MPSLKVFGRRTFFSTDDIQVEVRCGMIFRFIQICLSIPLLAWLIRSQDEIQSVWYPNVERCLNEDVDHTPEIPHQRLLNIHGITVVFASLSFGIATAGLIAYYWIYRSSLVGSPTDTSARRAVDVLCHLDVTLFGAVRIVNFAFGILLAAAYVDYCQCVWALEEADSDSGASGSVRYLLEDMKHLTHREMQEWRNLGVISSFRSTCDAGPYSAFAAIFIGLVICQCVDAIYMIFVYFCVVTRTVPNVYGQYIEAESKWHTCVSCCFTCLSCVSCSCLFERQEDGDAKAQGDFQHAAHWMNKFFDTDTLDITITDILVGMRITHLLHYEVEYLTRKQVADNKNRAHVFIGKVRNDAIRDDDADVAQPTEVKDDQMHRVNNGNDRTQTSAMVTEKDIMNLDSLVSNEKPSTEPVIDRRALLTRSKSHVPRIPTDFSAPKARVDRRRHGMTAIREELPFDLNITDSGSHSSYDGDDQVRGMHEEFKAVGRFLLPEARRALSVSCREDREIIAEACRYISFATNIYTWSLFDKRVDTGFICRRDTQSVTNHDFTPRHKSDHAGFAMVCAPIAGVKETDIVYARYSCDVVKCPFAVVLDHQWKSIIITVRGSTVLDDFVTDMTVDEVELSEWGQRCGFDGEGRFAHRGFLDSSAWIFDEIEKDGILDALVDDGSPYKGYSLRVVGHSLGAGISVILALFYRSRFPTVKAIAFEPPGCTCSSNLATESKDWTLAFVNATDVVPRMNFPSLVEVRDEVFFNLARIKINKQEVNAHSNIEKEGIDAVRNFLKHALLPEGDVNRDSEYMKGLVAFRKRLNEQFNKAVASGKTYDLALPGKTILFVPSIEEEIVHQKSKATCCSDSPAVIVRTDDPKAATAIYTETEVDYQNILLSDNFIKEHLTQVIQDVLSKLAESFDLQPPFFLVDKVDDSVERGEEEGGSSCEIEA